MHRVQGFSLGIATNEMIEGNYMQYDCASHPCFQYQQFNHMARQKLITLIRPHIPISAGAISKTMRETDRGKTTQKERCEYTLSQVGVLK